MLGITRDQSGRTNSSENKPEAVHSAINTDSSVEAGPTTSDVEQYELEDDVVFELLKESRRRKALKHLYDADGECTIGDLAERIAAEENGTDITQVSSDQRKRVYVGLYQCHLPKLDDGDVIDYDRSRGVIRLDSNAGTLLSYMEFNPKKREQSQTGVLERWINKL